MSKRSAEDSLENTFQKQKMDVSGISNAKNVQLFRYAKKVRLPRKVNKGLFRAAQLKQAAYNKARSAQIASEVAATEPMEWDGDGAYRRKRRSYRKRRTFRGRGGYLGNQAGSWLANAAMSTPYGAALRPWAPAVSSMAGAAGSWLEDQGVSRAKRWLGMGAYDQGNQLITDMGRMDSSTMRSTGDETGDIFITKREFIQDIIAPANGALAQTAFTTVVQAQINPGLTTLFPWLSQIAQYFEEYCFHQLIFEFKSAISGGNQNSGGTITMVCQYNPANLPFTSKQAMEQYDYSASSKIEDNLFHGIECDPAKKGGNTFEYVRTAAVPSGQDIKTYDLGSFQIAVSGIPANFNANTLIGELWVNYTVRLSKAKLQGGINAVTNFEQVNVAGTAMNQWFASGNTVSAAQFLTNPSIAVAVIKGQDNYRLKAYAPNAYQLGIVFPVGTVAPGNYSVYVDCYLNNGTNIISALPILTAVQNVTISDTTVLPNTIAAVSATNMIARANITITNSLADSAILVDFGATAVKFSNIHVILTPQNFTF